jgi:hypothetical protein
VHFDLVLSNVFSMQHRRPPTRSLHRNDDRENDLARSSTSFFDMRLDGYVPPEIGAEGTLPSLFRGQASQVHLER